MRILRFRDTAAPVVGSANSWTQGLMALSAAAERHYLPFDGVGDYAVGLNAATGVLEAGTSGQYCFVVKLRSADYGLGKRAGGLTDTTTGPPSNLDIGALAAYLYSSGATQYRHAAQTFSPGGSNEGAFAYTYGTPDAPVVMAHAVANTPSVSARGIFARGGSTLAASSYSPTTARDPQHLAIGTTIHAELSPAGGYGALQWVACVLLRTFASDGDIAAYSAGACHDAMTVWDPEEVHGYWVASDASGTSVPARVGNVPLTLVGGLTSGDLVSL